MKKSLAAGVSLLLAAGLASSAVAADVDRAPVRSIQGGDTRLDSVGDVVRGSDGTLYVVSPFWDAMFAHAPNASGNTPPIRTISGSKSLINTPSVVAIDKQDRVWTQLNGTSPYSIGMFSGSFNGNVSPLRTLGGSNTQLTFATGIAIAPNGDVYVSQSGSDHVLVFDSGAGGNVDPERVIVGPNTQLNDPTDLAVDAAGNLYVANAGAKITVFGPSASGNVPPARTISGPATTLASTTFVALDSGANVYVTDGTSDAVAVFAAGANGNVAPLTRLVGAATQLTLTGGAVVAPDRTVHVVEFGTAIRTFAPLVPLVKPGKVRALDVAGAKAAAKRTISWKAPAANPNAGAITQYVVTLKAGTKTLLTEKVKATVTKLVVARKKLKAGTVKVSVVAVNAQGKGPAATTSFKVV